MVELACNSSLGEWETECSIMLEKLQADETPCLKNQGRWNVRNYTHNCILVSTYMYIHKYTCMHTHSNSHIYTKIDTYMLCSLGKI